MLELFVSIILSIIFYFTFRKYNFITNFILYGVATTIQTLIWGTNISALTFIVLAILALITVKVGMKLAEWIDNFIYFSIAMSVVQFLSMWLLGVIITFLVRIILNIY